MATYVVLMNLTDSGAKHVDEIPQGIEQAHKAIEEMGGQVHGCYTLMGEYDFLGVYELPGDEAALTYALSMSTSGFVRTQTYKAFTPEELAKIIESLPKA